MCCQRGAAILAKVKARPGKSPTVGGTHPQTREAKERAGASQEIYIYLLYFNRLIASLSFISSPYVIKFNLLLLSPVFTSRLPR